MVTVAAKRCLSCGAGLPSDSLTCSFCETAHIAQGNGLLCACPACGAGNPLDAKHCGQCRAAVRAACPECTSFNPISTRFCHECMHAIRVVTYKSLSCRILDYPVATTNVRAEKRACALRINAIDTILELLLGSLDDTGQHPILDGLALFHTDAIPPLLDAVGFEDPQQIVFEGEEELARARIALTTGPAPKLIVDTPTLVPLCP